MTTAKVSFIEVKLVFDLFVVNIRRNAWPEANDDWKKIVKDCDPKNPMYCTPELASQHWLVTHAHSAAIAK